MAIKHMLLGLALTALTACTSAGPLAEPPAEKRPHDMTSWQILNCPDCIDGGPRPPVR
ncbi:hypothetical protein SAMN05892877_107281 [Rhizobium subbaraonis]|uniref:Lipoprotein n=1 Tax=Rhizobium subbaraonis TaxID=908946 RepID=A0A285UF41_9HYPH|nr:hypothetical protein SAMN05892877_107281 [Rhizobium subbaraonis]